MQSLKQRAARKHLYNQFCCYATLEDSLVKVLDPNVANVLQTVPFKLHMINTSTSYHKENMSAAIHRSLTEAMSSSIANRHLLDQ